MDKNIELEALAMINAPQIIPAWFNPSLPAVNNRIEGPETCKWWELLTNDLRREIMQYFMAVVEEGRDASQLLPPGTSLKNQNKFDFLKKPALAGIDLSINEWWINVVKTQQNIINSSLKNELIRFQLWRKFYAWMIGFGSWKVSESLHTEILKIIYIDKDFVLESSNRIFTGFKWKPWVEETSDNN